MRLMKTLLHLLFLSLQQSLKASDTRASLLRTHIVPVENVQLWKIPRFERKVSDCLL